MNRPSGTRTRGSCGHVAHLDTVFRAGIVDAAALKPIPAAIVDDLEAMLAIVSIESFRCTSRCVLNLTFGDASALVNGAHADLIIDDTLIDLKCGKNFVFDREIFNQLLGYYVLSCIGGIDDCPAGEIKHLAIYYARYGVLHRVPVGEVVRHERLPEFIEWFKRHASGEC